MGKGTGRGAADKRTDGGSDRRTDDDEILALDDGLDDLLVELEKEPDSAIVIYKSIENGEEAHCFAIGPKDLSWPALLEKIRADFGSGKYWARGRVGTRWRGRRKINIAPSRNAAPPAAAAAAAAAAPAFSSETKLIMDMMSKNEERNMRLLEALIGKQSAAPAQGMTFGDSIKLAEMMRGDRREPIVELTKYLELTKTLVGDREGGGGSGERNMWDALIAVMETMAPALVAAQHQAGAPVGGAPGAPRASAPALAAPGAAPAAGQAQGIAAMLGTLIHAAELDSDPGSYAVMISDQVGEEGLKRLLSLPDPVALMSKIDARVAQHAAWMTELVVELRTILAEWDKEPAVEPAASTPAPTEQPAT